VSTLAERFNTRVEAFLPERLRDDEDDVRRARLILLFSVVLAIFGTFFTVLFATDTLGHVEPFAFAAVVVGTCICVLNPFFLKRTGNPKAAGLVLVLTLQGAMTVSPLVGLGVDDPSVWWLVPVPVLAGFLLGGRGALALGTLVFVEFWLLLLADPVPYGENVNHQSAEIWIALTGSTAVLLLTVLAWGYERARERARKLLDDKLNELEAANAKLAAISEREQGRREAAEGESERKDDFLATMAATAASQGDALQDASSALTEMAESLRDIAANVESLREAAAASEGAISAVTAGGQAMSRTSNEMASAANNVAAAIYDLTSSMRGVSADVGALNQTAQAAVQEMEAMYHASTQVESRTSQARRLMEESQADAARGADAVLHALEGISLIGGNVTVVRDAVEELHDGVNQISQVLEVIDEVASQTQLLALNASILASQAGEHGRGFMVVASEIKKLSERTAESTEAIGARVRALSRGADRTRMAMIEGDAAVRSAVELSQTARTALGTLASSAASSVDTVAVIASATAEQGARARRMAEAMSQVAATLAEVVSEVGDQTAKSEAVLGSAERMRVLGDQVAMASDDQAQGGESIEQAVMRIHEMVRMLGNAHGEQTRGSELILRSIEAIHDRQLEQLKSIDEMKQG
jgi:methyl-accepting chemotaxis protein